MRQSNNLIAHLLDLLQNIAQNTEYPQFFVNERCLIDHKTYLDLCKYIFPELKPGFLEIQSLNASPAEKLDQLMLLLSEALKLDDLTNLDGSEITRYNLSHIQRLIFVLHEYSKIVNQTSKRKPVVRSQQGSGDERQHDPQVPKSARGPANDYRQVQRGQRRKQKHHQREPHRDVRPQNGHNRKKQNHPNNIEQPVVYTSDQNQKEQKHVHYADRPQYLMPAEPVPNPAPKKKASKSKKNRKARNQRAQRQNLHENVVHTIIKEKTRMMDAGVRENRKNKMEFIEDAKKSYSSYLKRYTKDNKAKNNREAILGLKSAGAVKPVKQELPRDDFKKIDDFFQSFAYKFRDQNAAYLRKVTQLVRRQELDRFCYHNRIEREKEKYLQNKLQSELQGARHQHRVRSAVLRENAQALQVEVGIMRKESLKVASEQKRELKEAKKKELKQIENVLRQDNEKVLMSLQQGGRLQQLIMKMYKKF